MGARLGMRPTHSSAHAFPGKAMWVPDPEPRPDLCPSPFASLILLVEPAAEQFLARQGKGAPLVLEDGKVCRLGRLLVHVRQS